MSPLSRPRDLSDWLERSHTRGQSSETDQELLSVTIVAPAALTINTAISHLAVLHTRYPKSREAEPVVPTFCARTRTYRAIAQPRLLLFGRVIIQLYSLSASQAWGLALRVRFLNHSGTGNEGSSSKRVYDPEIGIINPLRPILDRSNSFN